VQYDVSLNAYLLTYTLDHARAVQQSGQIRFLTNKPSLSLEFQDHELLKLECVDRFVIGLATIAVSDDQQNTRLLIWDQQTGQFIASVSTGSTTMQKPVLLIDTASTTVFVILEKTISIIPLYHWENVITIPSEYPFDLQNCHYDAAHDRLIALVNSPEPDNVRIYSGATGHVIAQSHMPLIENFPLFFIPMPQYTITKCSAKGELLYINQVGLWLASNPLEIRLKHDNESFLWSSIFPDQPLYGAYLSHNQERLFVLSERKPGTFSFGLYLLLTTVDMRQGKGETFAIPASTSLTPEEAVMLSSLGNHDLMAIPDTDLVIVAYPTGEVKAWNVQSREEICLLKSDRDFSTQTRLSVNLERAQIIIVQQKAQQLITHRIPYGNIT
jgi:hypothetical protein